MSIPIWESADGTVRKDVLEPGIFSKKATEGAQCRIIVEDIECDYFSIKDINKKVHSKIFDGPSEKTYVIGEADNEIDRQFERALQMMLVSEKSNIVIKLVLEGWVTPTVIQAWITMKHIEHHEPIWEWTPKKKCEVALRYKETGVKLFKEERWIDAFYRFSKACKILITLEPIPDLELDKTLESNINSLRLQLYSNIAACHLRRKNYEHAVTLCTKVLDKESNNVKVLYQRGVAYGSLGDIERAQVDLRDALKLEPHNPVIKEKYLVIRQRCQEANQRFDNMVRRMFKM